MELQAWFTLALIVCLVVVLAREMLSPAAAVLIVVVLLLVTDVISPEQALAGFSNPAPITVAALYLLARAVEKTGALRPIVAATLGQRAGPRQSLIRLLVPTAAASAFLNNTPIVAMLAPQVQDWASRRGMSPSTFLMPLSFATILGGTVTLIGTSTNLVVSGLLAQSGMPPLSMFELTPIGLPVALIGVVAVSVLAPFALPARRPAREGLSDDVRQFVVDMEVVRGGPLDAKSVEDAGLRHLQGVFLVQIDREGAVIAPVAPETVLRGGDRLRFVGKADLVVDLQRMRGLVSAERGHVPPFDSRRAAFFEVVIGASSPLAGNTLREAGFRNRYQAAVLAIHRSGRRIEAKLGAVRLHAGDTLLLLTDAGFRDRWYDHPDFLLVSRLGGSLPVSTRQAGLVGLIGAGIVLAAGSGVLPILESSLVGAGLLVLLGILSPREARNAVDLDVIVLIAASFGLGSAIEASGLAGAIADAALAVAADFGPLALLFAVVLATLLLTELITNNAAAVLIFPVAIATAIAAGLDPRPFVIAITVAASASFLTPIGYQTNTMVYGPGGYRFGDYARLGAPLTVVVIVLIMIVVPIVWPL
ncbi:MAG TPA: SLC13 family permease [Candidatus Limnocylindria bacterium]|nr:SLC13 family permease [Candidatus Limnocylindria bacterium]